MSEVRIIGDKVFFDNQEVATLLPVVQAGNSLHDRLVALLDGIDEDDEENRTEERKQALQEQKDDLLQVMRDEAQELQVSMLSIETIEKLFEG